MGDTAEFVTVVSGLPRSGTSMMMRMLNQGGLPAFSDRLRRADDDNPNGYYEFEPVKALHEAKSWVPDARGHALKVIYKLVYELPAGIDYRIVFMAREISEVMASQNRMLARFGISVSAAESGQLAVLFRAELAAFRAWVAEQRNMRILYLDYPRVLSSTKAAAAEIAAFLGLEDLDTDAMAAVVNAELYRNRA
jgi:hypothetical protein